MDTHNISYFMLKVFYYSRKIITKTVSVLPTKCNINKNIYSTGITKRYNIVYLSKYRISAQLTVKTQITVRFYLTYQLSNTQHFHC